MEKVLEREERYLVIDPSGELRWIRTSRDNMVRDFHKAIDCNWLENVYTELPGIVIIVDEVGKVKQNPQRYNPIASRLYAGREFGDFIHGPAVVASMGYVDGESDWIPCSDAQLQCVAQYLQIELPEVDGDD